MNNLNISWSSDGESSNDREDICNPIYKTTQNMKITVIKDITEKAGLNDENFDATLPKDINNWFQEFKSMWNIYKKTPAMIHSLQSLLLMNDNPLLLALKLYANCPGCDNIKTKNLAYFILETIINMKKEKQSISENCTDNIKMVAYNFVKTQGIPSIYQAVTDTYDLKKCNHLFVSKVRQLISNHYYKDASYWAAYLDLTERFSLFDIPLPLILQDKISIAEDYLDAAKHCQKPIIELLDSLLGGNSSVINNCDYITAEYNYPDIKMEKLHPKPLTKLIFRLAKKYNIPSESTPNVNYSKSYGYLQYLLHKKYIEKCMSNDAWRELIREFVITKPLQMELISSITLHSDFKEALYWSKSFHMPFEELPLCVQNFILKPTIKQVEEIEDESWDNELTNTNNISDKKKLQSDYNCSGTDGGNDESLDKNFYQLNLPENSVILVDTKDSFNNMIDELEKQKIIAFDSEWKPSFKGDGLVNLIQLAYHSKVFLIDVISDQFKIDQWERLGDVVFKNNTILKIGFSLNHDLLMFHKALPMLNINPSNRTAFFDLQDAWKMLKDVRRFKFPYKTQYSGESLRSLVELCFGKKLDKSNQFSNWANRPLRNEQKIYAALDAFCLLEIYDVIHVILTSIDIRMQTFVDNIIYESLNKIQKAKKKSSTSNPTPTTITVPKKLPSGNIKSPHKIPQKIDAIQFVCDEMLTGLTKHLRKLGIDCITINCKKENKCLELAQQENRYLLTKSFRFVKFVQYLPYGYCYKIETDNIDDQTKEVLQFFNLVLEKEDIFSRCQMCNIKEFILATRYDMKKIKYGGLNYCLRKKFHGKPAKRNFILKNITPEIIECKTTDQNNAIQYHSIPEHILDSVEYFYICQGCGKCYWDGTHLDKVLNNGSHKAFIKSC